MSSLPTLVSKESILRHLNYKYSLKVILLQKNQIKSEQKKTQHSINLLIRSRWIPQQQLFFTTLTGNVWSEAAEFHWTVSCICCLRETLADGVGGRSCSLAGRLFTGVIKTSERLHSALTSCSFTSIQVHSPIVKLWRCSVDLNLAEFWSFLISHWITSKRFVCQSRQMSRSHMPQGATPTSTFTNLSSPTRNPDRSRLLVGWLRMLKLQSRFVKLYFSFSKRVREREETLQTADNLRVV